MQTLTPTPCIGYSKHVFVVSCAFHHVPEKYTFLLLSSSLGMGHGYLDSPRRVDHVGPSTAPVDVPRRRFVRQAERRLRRDQRPNPGAAGRRKNSDEQRLEAIFWDCWKEEKLRS